jgi:hypothetical protein
MPKGAGFTTSATVVAARVQRDALTFRRSTAALASGTVAPKGSASGHASWDLASAGVTPVSLSQSSESRRTPVIVPAG